MKSAYGWENVVELGEQDLDEDDVNKVDALKNAGNVEIYKDIFSFDLTLLSYQKPMSFGLEVSDS